jgi:REP element-mobilizing transposase RayT
MEPESSRRTVRLRGFDYASPGWRFITICTHNRACIFGDLKAGSISLTPIGKIVQRTWAETPNHFPNVGLDEYVIMPNHLHGLLLIEDTTGVSGRNHTRFQVGFHKNDQHAHRPFWPPAMAAQLLRARYPGRGRPESHSGLHPGKPSPRVPRRGKPGPHVRSGRSVGHLCPPTM